MVAPFLFNSKNFEGKILLLTHQGADPDAICSAAVIKSFYKNKKIEIGIPENCTAAAKRIAEQFDIAYIVNPVLSEFDSIVLIETSSLERIGGLKKDLENFYGAIFLIDHHSISNFSFIPKSNQLLDPEAISTTEWLFKLCQVYKKKLTEQQTTLLALGLISDSAQFAHARTYTFEVMHELLKLSSWSYTDLLALLSHHADFSSKLASLKAMRQARIFRSGEFALMVLPLGGSFALNSLLLGGADGIIFCEFEKRKNQTTLRVCLSPYVLSRLKLNLTKDIFFNIQKTINGNFGGHNAIGSFVSENNVSEKLILLFLAEFTKLVKKIDSTAKLKEYLG
ncbi:MAG: DHH family phosphoesterase [Candidatus Diapherotrites archaeon]|nr:DHH family phosphoesterase [Candidatus Diapherotrites archaeon]